MLNFKSALSIATITVLGLTGCSVKEDVVTNSDSKIQELRKEIENKNATISQLEKEKKELVTINNQIVATPNTASSEVDARDETSTEDSGNNSLVPLNAKAGECYAKVLVPAKYETKTEKQLVKEAQNQIEVIPATYKVVEKKVTLREASTKLISVPATYKEETKKIMITPESKELITVPTTYKTVVEKVMVSPETTKLETVPATYKTIVEKKEIKPAYKTWKKGRGEIEKVDNSTGEILCLVEVPAVYETIEKKVIDKPAHTKEVVIPAEYKEVQKKVVDKGAYSKEVVIPASYKIIPVKVIDEPAHTKEVKIPAICKIVKTREIDSPAKEIKTEIPAEYKEVATNVKVTDSYLRWQPILCETNTTPDLIEKLQEALQAKKYNITSVDGIYGSETKAAVNAYQKDNQLSEGALTLKTLKSLGL